MAAFRTKFVVRRHKPEAPDEQKILIENLQAKVLRKVDTILLVIRHRQPRTAASWDHGGPHDSEIGAMRGEIAHAIQQSMEEGFSFHNDSNFELKGLLSEAQRMVSNLKKMDEDRRCTSCQNQGAPAASGGGTASGEGATSGEGAASGEEAVYGEGAASTEGANSGKGATSGTGSGSTAGPSDPSSNAVQGAAAGKGGTMGVFEEEKNESDEGNCWGVSDIMDTGARNEEQLPPSNTPLEGEKEGWDKRMDTKDVQLLVPMGDSVFPIITNSRRTGSTRRFAPWRDWKVPAIGRTSPSSANIFMVENFGGTGGGRGDLRADTSPIAECDGFWGPAEARKGSSPSKPYWEYFQTT